MSKPDSDSLDSKQAPACFGSPSCFASDSDICKQCTAGETCGSEVMNTLERIKQVIDVDDLLHKHRQAIAKERNKRKPTPKKSIEKPVRQMPKEVERTSKVEKIVFDIDENTQQLIATLPVKAQPFATTLCKSGLVDRIKKDMSKGINPLERTGPKFLSVALKQLLDGGFTRAELRSAFIEQLNWSENSAASHVSLVVKLFLMFDIASEIESRIVANPTLMTDNQT